MARTDAAALRNLPSVDEVLRTDDASRAIEHFGRPAVVGAVWRNDERVVAAVLDKDWWGDPRTLRLYVTTKRWDDRPLPDLGKVPGHEKVGAVIAAVLSEVGEK